MQLLRSLMQMLAGSGAMWSRRVLARAPAAVALHGASVSSLANGFCHLLLTTFSDGCLGSNNDEGRSEVR